MWIQPVQGLTVGEGLSTGGGLIITSTPNGDGDLFAEIWRSATDVIDPQGNKRPYGRGKNGFKAFMATWDRHPDRDDKWAEEQKAQLGEDRFKREYNCEFITSEETLIDSLRLQRLQGIEPIHKMGLVRFYDKILPNRYYVVGLDPATGTATDNGDKAAIQVFRLPDMVQVMEWSDNKAPTKVQVTTMLEILKYIHNELAENPEQVLKPEETIYWTFENNAIGEAINAIIYETGEEKFPGILVHEPSRRGGAKGKRGLTTTNKNKVTACMKLKSLLESDRLEIRSEGLVGELKNFVRKGMGFQAKPGLHDDLVSSTLLIIRLADIIKDYELELSKTLSEIIDLEDEADAPLPFIMIGGY